MCTSDAVFLFIYVHSAPSHAKLRVVIRETWGNSKNYQDVNIKLVFLCGTVKDKVVQSSEMFEADTFGDIIQDSYPT